MNVSELIAALQANLSTDGDRVVAIQDADTGWHLAISEIETDPKSGRVILTGLYGDALDEVAR